jgi:hypothetical protein
MKVLILTVYDQRYSDYAKLFEYCAKKAYPEYDVRAIGRSEIEKEYGVFPDNKATTSTMRFCLPDSYYAGYDYVLITDVDMLIYRETMPIHEQHLAVMVHTGYPYENLAVPIQGHGYRMPGILFASEAWFDRTSNSRAALFASLKDPQSATYYEADEVALYKLCEPFGYTRKGTEKWRWHGIHMGKYCRRPGKSRRMSISIQELTQIHMFLEDDGFIELVATANPQGECSHTMGVLADMCGTV